VGGPWLAGWICVAAACSQVGQYQAEMASDSYQVQGMAERGFLPRALGVRSRHGTPVYGIVLSSAGVLCLASMSFVEIVTLLNAIYCLAELLEFAAFVWLRVKRPDLPRPYSDTAADGGADTSRPASASSLHQRLAGPPAHLDSPGAAASARARLGGSGGSSSSASGPGGSPALLHRANGGASPLRGGGAAAPGPRRATLPAVARSGPSETAGGGGGGGGGALLASSSVDSPRLPAAAAVGSPRANRRASVSGEVGLPCLSPCAAPSSPSLSSTMASAASAGHNANARVRRMSLAGGTGGGGDNVVSPPPLQQQQYHSQPLSGPQPRISLPGGLGGGGGGGYGGSFTAGAPPLPPYRATHALSYSTGGGGGTEPLGDASAAGCGGSGFVMSRLGQRCSSTQENTQGPLPAGGGGGGGGGPQARSSASGSLPRLSLTGYTGAGGGAAGGAYGSGGGGAAGDTSPRASGGLLAQFADTPAHPGSSYTTQGGGGGGGAVAAPLSGLDNLSGTGLGDAISQLRHIRRGSLAGGAAPGGKADRGDRAEKRPEP
ncbi:hypothetical protein TSOC_014020, partial [Tetrabaena socialis]